MKINGKRVLITGGSSGIGLALANILLAKGAKGAISGRRPDVVADAVRALQSESAEVHGIAADIATAEAGPRRSSKPLPPLAASMSL